MDGEAARECVVEVQQVAAEAMDHDDGAAGAAGIDIMNALAMAMPTGEWPVYGHTVEATSTLAKQGGGGRNWGRALDGRRPFL
jgi:hypothetical protein